MSMTWKRMAHIICDACGRHKMLDADHLFPGERALDKTEEELDTRLRDEVTRIDGWVVSFDSSCQNNERWTCDVCRYEG